MPAANALTGAGLLWVLSPEHRQRLQRQAARAQSPCRRVGGISNRRVAEAPTYFSDQAVPVSRDTGTAYSHPRPLYVRERTQGAIVPKAWQGALPRGATTSLGASANRPGHLL